jgi:hypothetical protein
MISFIKGLFGSKKPTETQPHPLDIAKYTPPAEPAPITQEQADKVLATKAWPFPTSTPPAAAPEPAPVEEKKPRKPRAKKEVSAIPVPKPTTKPRAKK